MDLKVLKSALKKACEVDKDEVKDFDHFFSFHVNGDHLNEPRPLETQGQIASFIDDWFDSSEEGHWDRSDKKAAIVMKKVA